MGTKAYKKNKMEEDADKIIEIYSNLPDAKDVRKIAKKKMSGGMAIGGGHKNYKMTGMMTAKYGKMAKSK